MLKHPILRTLKKTTSKKVIQLLIGCIIFMQIFTLSRVQVVFSDEYSITNVSKERTVISGIVEENNTALGYIALFNPDSQGDIIQIFNYLDPQKVEVIKNHKKSNLASIEEGDTAFIKIDEEGYITSISLIDNYVVKYGRIVRKFPLTITVEFDNKEQEVFRISSEVGIVSGGRKVQYSQLKDGDSVKLLISEKTNRTVLKEIIIIEEVGYEISNIYKAKINRIDDLTKKFFVSNLMLFNKGRWERAGIKGIYGFKLSEDFVLSRDNQKIDILETNKYYRNNEVYLASTKDYGGQEQIAVALLRDEFDSEIIYNDSVIKTMSGSESFNLAGNLKNILYSNNSIILKEQKLVTGLSISEDDKVYVVANRDWEGNYKASLVQIYNKADFNNLVIYRGRIKAINEYGDFTVESYSVLQDFDWKFYNTPKTFNITFDTRVLNENGLIGQEEFIPYGQNSYIGKVVYIVSNGLDASLISTAPYGSYMYIGEVFKLENSVVNIVNVKLYDSSSKIWKDSKEANINILNNSIILKKGEVIKSSQLQKGDKVRIVKRDKTNTGDAYLIIVE